MPDGPLCAAHPQAGVATCPHCGTFVCDQCVTRYAWGGFACRACAQRGRPRHPLAWQERMSVRSWWQAFVLVLFQPRRLFSHFPELSLPRALVFAAIGLSADIGSTLAGSEPGFWWLGIVGTLLATPLMALAVHVWFRITSERASFPVLLAAMWLLDGAYDLVTAPLNLLQPDAPASSLLSLAVFSVVAVIYVRVLWWLGRWRFGLSAGQALLAMVVYCFASLLALLGGFSIYAASTGQSLEEAFGIADE